MSSALNPLNNLDADISIEGSDTIIDEKLSRPTNGPAVFEVSLTSYPLQPWVHAKTNLNQWFNYGLNPTTWTRYSLQQIKLFKDSQLK